MKVLVLHEISGENKKLFLDSLPTDTQLIFCDGKAVGKEQIRDAEVIFGNPPAGLLADADKLCLLQLRSAGADGYIQPGILPKQAVLTNATGAYGLAISEHMIGVTFSLVKKLHLYRDNQAQGLWKDEGSVRSIEGSTVLIVGLGDIGGEYAKKMKALGAYTIGIKRRPAPKLDYIDELYLTDRLDEMLGRADIVALCMPGNKETKDMFSGARFDRMKKGAILINVGRGSAVDTDALADALESGQLGGAALDVTEPEPLPETHRLWRMKNAVITPHISGGSHLEETDNRIVRIAIRNIRNLIEGKPFENVVDFETGYRR